MMAESRTGKATASLTVVSTVNLTALSLSLSQAAVEKVPLQSTIQNARSILFCLPDGK